MRTCGRCGATGDVRLSLVNLAREARRDGLEHVGPEYGWDDRCRDRDACARRARHRRHVTPDADCPDCRGAA